ncbi:hypothetical protein ACTA71_006376 [Dictyostelium dimigraforme]
MTIINNSKKCLQHPTNDVLFICTQCNNVQICTKCVTSKDFHSGHQMIEIGEEIPNSTIVQESNKKFEQKTKEHENELKVVQDVFNSMKKALEKCEENEINKMKATHQENIKTHSTFISNLESNNQSSVSNPQYKDNLITINEVLIKEISISLKEIVNVSDLKKESNKSSSSFSSSSSSCSKSSQEATTANVQSPQISQKIYPKDDRKSTHCHFANKEFLIYRNGDIIPNGTENIAIAYGHSVPASIPSFVDGILLPDGYNEPFPNFPPTCKKLFVFDIKIPLNKNTIPPSIKTIHFGSGFSQQITKDTIPSTVIYLMFEDIVHPLTTYSIPDTVHMVFASENLKYSLDGVLPNNVKVIKSTPNKKYKFGVPIKSDYIFW